MIISTKVKKFAKREKKSRSPAKRDAIQLQRMEEEKKRLAAKAERAERERIKRYNEEFVMPGLRKVVLAALKQSKLVAWNDVLRLAKIVRSSVVIRGVAVESYAEEMIRPDAVENIDEILKYSRIMLHQQQMLQSKKKDR